MAANEMQYRNQPMDYSKVRCPVSERAAFEESAWLSQFLLIGDEGDAEDVARAVAKVSAGREELAGANPELAGGKVMGRAQRARFEREKNY